MNYLSALLRNWWVVLIGVGVAVAVGLAASYAKRTPIEYTASARMLVTSAEAPYFRTSTTRVVRRPLNPTRNNNSSSNSASADVPLVETQSPDTKTLVQAANLYPLLIESDLVTAERQKLYGTLPGTVEAKAVYSLQTENRIEESPVPVIEVSATARRPSQAVDLADKTVAAFTSWIAQQQVSAEVDEDQRILVSPLWAARVVSESGGPTYAIPALLGIAVALAFCGLAVLLDSVSRRPRLAAAPSPERSPAP